MKCFCCGRKITELGGVIRDMKLICNLCNNIKENVGKDGCISKTKVKWINKTNIVSAKY